MQEFMQQSADPRAMWYVEGMPKQEAFAGGRLESDVQYEYYTRHAVKRSNTNNTYGNALLTNRKMQEVNTLNDQPKPAMPFMAVHSSESYHSKGDVPNDSQNDLNIQPYSKHERGSQLMLLPRENDEKPENSGRGVPIPIQQSQHSSVSSNFSFQGPKKSEPDIAGALACTCAQCFGNNCMIQLPTSSDAVCLNCTKNILGQS